VQLAAAFPASLVNRSQEESTRLRRQWVLAFKENGITTMEQVKPGCGWRAVRKDRFCLPWPICRLVSEGRCVLGITVSDVMTEYWKWRSLFSLPEQRAIPWPKPVLYHICIELRHRELKAN
jgi:hypothetical protein